VTVSLANNTIAFDNDGVYSLSLTGSISHDSSNSGREFRVRAYDTSAGAELGRPFRVFTGRNADGSTIAFVALLEITEAMKGNPIRFEVGGTTDSYTAIDFDGEVSVYSVSEWREPLPSNDP